MTGGHVATKSSAATPSKVPVDFHLLSEAEQAELIARDFEPKPAAKAVAKVAAPVAKAVAKAKK
jgi:hypothetical protein